MSVVYSAKNDKVNIKTKIFEATVFGALCGEEVGPPLNHRLYMMK